MHTATVYALFDPLFPDLYRYVGCTLNLRRRIVEHCNLPWNSPCRLCGTWCRLLMDAGRLPGIVGIDWARGDTWKEALLAGNKREQHWISALTGELPLLNKRSCLEVLHRQQVQRPIDIVKRYTRLARHIGDFPSAPYPLALIDRLEEYEAEYPSVMQILSVGDLRPKTFRGGVTSWRKRVIQRLNSPNYELPHCLLSEGEKSPQRLPQLA